MGQNGTDTYRLKLSFSSSSRTGFWVIAVLYAISHFSSLQRYLLSMALNISALFMPSLSISFTRFTGLIPVITPHFGTMPVISLIALKRSLDSESSMSLSKCTNSSFSQVLPSYLTLTLKQTLSALSFF